jgi:hypothetical protein
MAGNRELNTVKMQSVNIAEPENSMIMGKIVLE